MKVNGVILASIPLLPASYILFQLLCENNPLITILSWIQIFIQHRFQGVLVFTSTDDGTPQEAHQNILNESHQLLAYILIAVFGYWATDYLIPAIKSYTLRKGISGKDLGKRGTKLADKDVPEALGIVPGAIFLICLTFCLVGFATSHPRKVSINVRKKYTLYCFLSRTHCKKYLYSIISKNVIDA